MTITINTNVSAMVAQRNLRGAAMESASSLAKLSSGSRVPTAKDDAAALAIGSRLSVEVAGLRQAGLNAGQASSMLQIAEGAMGQISDILVRMQSLAIQSKSGQLSSTERSILDTEFAQLQSEIDRIAADTKFNGTQLLAGGETTFSLNRAVDGVLENNGIDVTFTGSGTASTGDAFRITYDYTASTSKNITLTNVNTGEKVTKDIRTDFELVSGGDTANLSAGETFEVSFDDLGVVVTLNNDFDADADISLTTAEGAGVTVQETDANLAIGTVSAVEFRETSVDNTAITALKAAGGFNQETGDLSIAVNGAGVGTANISAAGFEFSIDGGTSFASSVDIDTGGANTVIVRLASGAELFQFEVDTTAVTTGATTTDGEILVDMEQVMFGATLATSASSQSFTYQIGTGVDANQDVVSVSLSAISGSALGVADGTIGIDNVSNATSAITAITAAIDTLNTARATVGAAQNRLDFASANLAVAEENNAAARSALMDVDVSVEMTEFTSKQVLIQAGVSMLAQANQQPALLLRLLQ